MQNVCKLILLLIVGGLSLDIGSSKINELVKAVHQREKTLADAMIQQQVQAMLKEAEKEIAQVEEEEKVKIKVEEVSIKPPLPEKASHQEQVEKVSQETVVAKESVTQEKDKEAKDNNQETSEFVEKKIWIEPENQIDLATYSNLTEEEVAFIGAYLIEHYFLFGYDYYTREEDPVRYERKKLASDMEDQMIASLQSVFGLSRNWTNLNKVQLQAIKEEATTYATAFQEQFKQVGKEDPVFSEIYKSGNAFFRMYLQTIEDIEQVFTALEQTTNKVFILPILMNQLNETVIPSVKALLNEGFTLKEKTNTIYIEGMDDSFLLTPQEVIVILENPYSILRPEEETEREEVPLDEGVSAKPTHEEREDEDLTKDDKSPL